MNSKNTFWAYDCPKHGLETDVFCFSAFSGDQLDNWKLLAYEEVETTHDQRYDHWMSVKVEYQKYTRQWRVIE